MWYALPMQMTPDQYMSKLALPEVYRVGGSVRDEIIGREAKDSDYIVRGATLDELAAALQSSRARISPLKLRTGQQVGWRAKVKHIGVLEVVLPRMEQCFGGGRHDVDIRIDKDLELAQDAVRRDFTINALYRNVHSGSLIDPLGTGLPDLQRKLISTTQPLSFHDDPLRTLRALRFVSVLGFDLHELTVAQMTQHADSVTGLTQKGVSGTALDELSRILMGTWPKAALEYAATTGVLQVLLPELAPMIGYEQRSRYHEKTTSDHTFCAVQAAANMHTHAPLRVRLALLFHDSGKPLMAWTDEDGLQHYYALSQDKAIELGAPAACLEDHEIVGARQARKALNRLNAPKDLTRDVTTLIERHMLPLHENIKPFKVRKWRAKLGDEMFRDLITHRLCDVLGKGGETTEAVEILEWIANEQNRAVKAEVPVTVKDLDISGAELRDIGLVGPEIGKVLRQLLHEVLAQPRLNENEWLAKRAYSLNINKEEKC